MTSPTRAAAAVLVVSAVLGGCGAAAHSTASARAPAMSSMSNPAAAPAAAAPAAAAPAPAAAPVFAQSRKAAAAAKAAATTSTSPSAVHSTAGAPAPSGSELGVPTSALAGRSISYNAEETLRVDDVGKAVSSVEAALAAVSGLLADSDRSGLGDEATANLVLKVPPGGFNSLLDRIGKIGEVTDRNLTGNDVTDQVVDVAGRVDSQRKSVDRVRALMAQATRLSDVVDLEGELSSREADLEALLARQQKLAQQVDLATVTVHLQTKQHPAPPPVQHRADRAGFVSGLDDGWTAFTGSLAIAAAVLGAVLPFALLALLLAPLAVLVQRRLRRGSRLGEPTTGLDVPCEDI